MLFPGNFILKLRKKQRLFFFLFIISIFNLSAVRLPDCDDVLHFCITAPALEPNCVKKSSCFLYDLLLVPACFCFRFTL